MVSVTDLELQLKLKDQQHNDLSRKREIELLAQSKDLEMIKRVQEEKDARTALTIEKAVLEERLRAKDELFRVQKEHVKEKDAYSNRIVEFSVENKSDIKKMYENQVSHHQTLERDILTRQPGRAVLPDLLYSQTYFSGGTKQISNNPIPFVVDSRKEVQSEGPLQITNFAAPPASEPAVTSSEGSSAGQALVVGSREHVSQQVPRNRALAAENERLKCQRCDDFDHIATHCPEKYSRPIRRGEPDDSSPNAQCGRCFQGGHKPSHCLAKISVPLQLLSMKQSQVQQ